MRRIVRFTRRPAAIVVVAGLAAVAALLGTSSAPAATDGAGAVQAGHQCLVMTGSGDPAFVKNFNPYTATGLPSGGFVRGAFYEPLIISTVAGGGHQYPWLAQSWNWSNGNKTLTLNIQKGVKWSDGVPLDLGRRRLQPHGRDAEQGDGHDRVHVARLECRLHQGVRALQGRHQPQDRRLAVHPGGAQPAVRRAEARLDEGARSGHVHEPEPGRLGSVQPDHALHDTGLRVQQEPALLEGRRAEDPVPGICPGRVERRRAAADPERPGRLDAHFVPNVAGVYTSKDPSHYHAFYATTAYPVSLVFDDTVYPYSIVAFRKALSLAINRSDVSKLGEYGYAPATDALGIANIFPTWESAAVKKVAQAAAKYDPAAAKALLTSNGFTYKGSTLIDPKGNPVNLDIHVISGWSDWVASNQIITKNLQAIGINSNVKLEPDWNSWYPNASATKNPTLLWQNASQGSPYGFFLSNLSQLKYTPSGQDATNTGNWSHIFDQKATAVLNQWKSTLNTEKQQQYAAQLANIFLQQQPIVPLFVGPRWSTYSTKYFHCFASPKSFYGDPIFTTAPDNVLSFTTICPGGKAGA